MRQEEFDNIRNLLNTDPMFGVKIFDLTGTPTVIVKNSKLEQIIEKYGSVDDMFNSFLPNKITKIGIQPLRKNGENGTTQNWIHHPKFNYLEISLIPAEAQPQTQAQNQPVGQFQSNMPTNYNVMPLNGSNGLSLPEMISLHVDRNDKTRLEVENKFQKEKIERLEAENLAYKERELASKYDTLKTDKNTELILGLVQNADKLKGIFSPAAPVGVGQVVEGSLAQPGLTQVQTVFMSIAQSVDDQTLQYLIDVYNASMNNEETYKAIYQILNPSNEA